MHFIKNLQWFNKGHNLANLQKLGIVVLNHVRSTKIINLFLYYNVFIRYESLYVNGQKGHLFMHFKLLYGKFSLIIYIASLYTFKETHIIEIPISCWVEVAQLIARRNLVSPTHSNDGCSLLFVVSLMLSCGIFWKASFHPLLIVYGPLHRFLVSVRLAQAHHNYCIYLYII